MHLERHKVLVEQLLKTYFFILVCSEQLGFSNKASKLYLYVTVSFYSRTLESFSQAQPNAFGIVNSLKAGSSNSASRIHIDKSGMPGVEDLVVRW